MTNIYVKYIPIHLDKKWYYTISHQIKIPFLEWKVVIKDEPILWIETPNTVYDFGVIEVLDDTLVTEVETLIDEIGVAVAMKKITNEEARQMLLDNNYIETENGFLIQEAITDWWIEIPAKYLII